MYLNIFKFTGLSGLGAHTSLVPFVVTLYIIVIQSLSLLVCRQHADSLFGFAFENKNCKLLTKSWNVRV